MTTHFASLSLSILLLAAHPAFAEKADRDKPLQIEAGKMSIDDAKKVQILEGDVVLIKGTMILKAERVVISEDQYGFQMGTATGGKGGLARFRQKREGRNEYVEGEGERIEYNSNSEVLELFHRAWMKSSEDQVKGDYIKYDTISEKYLVTATDSREPNAPPTRVRAIIQPKNKNSGAAAPDGKNESMELKESTGIQRPPAHE